MHSCVLVIMFEQIRAEQLVLSYYLVDLLSNVDVLLSRVFARFAPFAQVANDL